MFTNGYRCLVIETESSIRSRNSMWQFPRLTSNSFTISITERLPLWLNSVFSHAMTNRTERSKRLLIHRKWWMTKISRFIQMATWNIIGWNNKTKNTQFKRIFYSGWKANNIIKRSPLNWEQGYDSDMTGKKKKKKKREKATNGIACSWTPNEWYHKNILHQN